MVRVRREHEWREESIDVKDAHGNPTFGRLVRLARLLMLTSVVWVTGCGTQSLSPDEEPSPRSDDATELVWEVMAHYAPAYDVAWHPDGSYVAVTAMDQPMSILDTRTGVPVDWRAGRSMVVSVGDEAITWSADGRHLAVPGMIRDATTWEVMAEYGESGRTSDALAFSPDGAMLAGSSRPIGGGQTGCICIMIWDTATGAELRAVPTPMDSWGWYHAYVSSVAWNEDGSLLAASTGSGTPVIDVATGDVVTTLPPSRAVSWSPDGRRIALGGNGDFFAPSWSRGYVDVVDVATWTSVQRRQVHTDSVLDIAWSPQAPEILTSGMDGFVRVLDAESLDVRMARDLGSPVTVVEPRRDGSELAAGTRSGSIHVLSLPDLSGELHARTGGGRVQSMDLSADGALVASGGSDGRVRIWAADSGALVAEFATSSPARFLDWSDDGAWLAVGSDAVDLYRGDDITFQRRVVDDEPLGLAFDPAGSRLAISTTAGLRVVDVETGRILWDSGDTPLPSIPAEVDWSPDGNRIAVAFYLSGLVWVVDLTEEGGPETLEVPSFMDTVTAHAWSPSGAHLLLAGGDSSGFQDRRAVLFDIEAGVALWEYAYEWDGWILDAGFTEDGDTAWAAGGREWMPSVQDADTSPRLLLWDASSGELLAGLSARGTIADAALVGTPSKAFHGTWSGWLTREDFR